MSFGMDKSYGAIMVATSGYHFFINLVNSIGNGDWPPFSNVFEGYFILWDEKYDKDF